MAKQICVLGLGYIGLPTASVLATHGCKVYGVEVRPQVRESVARGVPPVEEPGLNTLVEAAVKSGNLTVGSEPKSADVFIICVPTPHDPQTHRADLSFVSKAAESILPYLKKGNLVILESTVPPGTTEKLLVPILAKSKLKVSGDLFVAHCPERVLPGKMLTELVSNDRIIGGLDKASTDAAKAVYSLFVTGKIFPTSAGTAEAAKLAENTFRDVNIAFANELDNVCSYLGINTWEVIRLANRHPRVNILEPGPGVGGHCIAVDPWFLATSVPESLSPLIRVARQINDTRPDIAVQRIEAAAKTVKKSKPKVALLGLTYKANVDDVRESPALSIAKNLASKKNIEVLLVDEHARPHLNGTLSLSPLPAAVQEADVIALLVAHKEFLELDWYALAKQKGKEKILDFRGITGQGEG